MTKTIRKEAAILFLCLALGSIHFRSYASTASDSKDTLEEELHFLKAESVVVTATKIAENVEKSVATVTVISERQIKQMGARNLLDILKTVPGLGIGQTASSFRELETRGIVSTFSERVLIMLNGHPVDHNLFWGGSMIVYDDLPIDNVKRIEVVRGPGSALYGANAFLATINIFTKEAKDIQGAAAAVGGGSFDTQQYNALVGKTSGNWHGMANFHYGDTDGPESFLKKDSRGNSGNISLGERRRDLEWRFGYSDNFVIDGRFISKDTGTFVGPSGFLSNSSEFHHDDSFIRGTVEYELNDSAKIIGRAYYSYFDMDQTLEFLPGTLFRFLSLSEKVGGEIQGNYKFSESNVVIGGMTYESQELSGVQQQVGPVYGTLSPYLPYSDDAQRNLWGIYLQDRWDATDTLRVILGGRYDRYSDFGGTFNPRLGFNWQFLNDYSLRFSYGTAFRAPTFSELYSKNNPTVKGNPDLGPETIDTYELGLNANWTPQFTSNIVLFRNEIDQMINRKITLDSSGKTDIRYGNVPGIATNGLEFSTRYTFSENSYISFNYTYQNSKFVATDRRVQDTPEHRGTLQTNIAILPYLHWYSDLQMRGSTARVLNDPRHDSPGYVIANTTLRTPGILPGLEMNFSIFNLFDKEATYPIPLSSVQNDLPQPGRTFFAKLRYELPL